MRPSAKVCPVELTNTNGRLTETPGRTVCLTANDNPEPHSRVTTKIRLRLGSVGKSNRTSQKLRLLFCILLLCSLCSALPGKIYVHISFPGEQLLGSWMSGNEGIEGLLFIGGAPVGVVWEIYLRAIASIDPPFFSLLGNRYVLYFDYYTTASNGTCG